MGSAVGEAAASLVDCTAGWTPEPMLEPAAVFVTMPAAARPLAVSVAGSMAATPMMTTPAAPLAAVASVMAGWEKTMEQGLGLLWLWPMAERA